jgi:hypothetical protein
MKLISLGEQSVNHGSSECFSYLFVLKCNWGIFEGSPEVDAGTKTKTVTFPPIKSSTGRVRRTDGFCLLRIVAILWVNY